MLYTESNWGYVYFIQAETGGPIKIGSAMNVDRRLKQLQTGNPEQLVLLHSTKGGKRLESFLHKKFKAYNKFCEWFHLNDGLLAYVQKLKEEDEIYGEILSLKEFLLQEDDKLSSDEIGIIIRLSRGDILTEGLTAIATKIKYWRMLDNYLEYQKIFPRRILSERLFTCFINEGKQDSDISLRKQRNIKLRNM